MRRDGDQHGRSRALSEVRLVFPLSGGATVADYLQGLRMSIMEKHIMISLSREELSLLLYGLGNGIGDDAIENLGLTKKEQNKLSSLRDKLTALARHRE